jgi:hypothetical protein
MKGMIMMLVALAKANISILGPQPLKDDFGVNKTDLDIVYSNFGRIPYGQSINGQVHFTPKNPLGCNKTDLVPI